MGLVSLFREQSGADSADSYSERPSQPRFVPVEGARMRSADAPRIGKEASRRSGYGGRAIVPPRSRDLYMPKVISARSNRRLLSRLAQLSRDEDAPAHSWLRPLRLTGGRAIEPLGIVRADHVAAIAHRVLEAAGGALQDSRQPSRGDETMVRAARAGDLDEGQWRERIAQLPGRAKGCQSNVS